LESMFDGPAHIVTVAMMCDWTLAVLGEGSTKGQLLWSHVSDSLMERRNYCLEESSYFD